MIRFGMFALVLTVGSGCRMTISADRLPGPVPTENAELMDYIAELSYVTAEPGYRAAHILWKGESFTGDYATLAATLEQADIIDDWNDGPNDALIKAKIGYMICRALDIQRGLNWSATGWGRYAWRDLTYLGIGTSEGELGYLSGGEFLGILARATDYVDRRYASQSQRIDLGPRPTD